MVLARLKFPEQLTGMFTLRLIRFANLSSSLITIVIGFNRLVRFY